MELLQGEYAYIVFGIEEGRGFDLVQTPFYVCATWNGRRMNTDLVDGGFVDFNTELVWQTGMKQLNHAIDAYENISLEVLTYDRKSIGFVLLCLQTAVVHPGSRRSEAGNVPFSWTNLLSVPPEYCDLSPELCLYIIVRDYVPDVSILGPAKTVSITPLLSAYSTRHAQEAALVYDQGGFVQLGGAGPDRKRYQLKLKLLTGYDLDVLLPENIIFEQCFANLRLSIHMFGLDLTTRTTLKEVHARLVDWNESIFINLESDYKTLGLYFEQYPAIGIKFYAEQNLLGWGEIDMRKLNLDLPQEIFRECRKCFEMEQFCFLEGHYRPTTSQVEMRRAIVSVECMLEAIDYFDAAASKNTETLAAALVQDLLPALAIAAPSPTSESATSKSVESVSTTDERGANEPTDADDYRDRQRMLAAKAESEWLGPMSNDAASMKMSHPMGDSVAVKDSSAAAASVETAIADAVGALGYLTSKARLECNVMHFYPKIDLFLAGEHTMAGRTIINETLKFDVSQLAPSAEQPVTSPADEHLATMVLNSFAQLLSRRTYGDGHVTPGCQGGLRSHYKNAARACRDAAKRVQREKKTGQSTRNKRELVQAICDLEVKMAIQQRTRPADGHECGRCEAQRANLAQVDVDKVTEASLQRSSGQPENLSQSSLKSVLDSSLDAFTEAASDECVMPPDAYRDVLPSAADSSEACESPSPQCEESPN